MAVRPGEENVATLFGDIHYFYGPPTANPPHHRFDKGSYVYLFENAEQRRARIEVANQPGSDDQDAFDGYLDKTHVRYSYRQQCLVSITVDGVAAGPPSADASQWHLPTFDPRNENKYHYRLHTLDIYFWTQADALQFVNGVRRVLPPGQVDVADEPAPATASPAASHHQALAHSHSHTHSQDVNPLVQKLEKAAISDPRIQHQQQGSVPSFAPPPSSNPPAAGARNDSPQSFAPMAYNPAAPPTAERHQYREKTPPPEDDGHNPLAAALARDHAGPGHGPGPGPFSPGYGQTTFSPQPGQTYGGPISPGIASPGFAPGQLGHLQRATTMPMSPGLGVGGGAGAGGMASPGLGSPSPYGGAAFPGSPGFSPPPPPPPSTITSPQQHTPVQNVGGYQQPPQLQQQQQQHNLPPPPPGGYSQFNYNNAGAGQGGGEYAIHQQLYRPTEQEHAVRHGGGGADYRPKQEGQHSRLGQGAERLERGVTGMLKKFEKKFA
ncbi:hypothetical protein F4777DRAFT_16183 [Nemania sp. FL0916]|nr:hypothetical protein F4777DRAFT_16183 [Nemania sp. FL0916]